MNFAIFLRTPFLKGQSGACFWISPPPIPTRKDTNPRTCSNESSAELVLQTSKADATASVLTSSFLLPCCRCCKNFRWYCFALRWTRPQLCNKLRKRCYLRNILSEYHVWLPPVVNSSRFNGIKSNLRRQVLCASKTLLSKSMH